MKIRTVWLNRIHNLWQSRSVIWLAGVRRTGKTTLCQSISEAEYFDCELPRIRQQLQEPEGFLEHLSPGKPIILDEVHRLPNPSELLKIAADHYPELKIIATGSSTLSASKKFRDTLTGRKYSLWLTPMTADDLVDFGDPDLNRRLLQGGLPPFWLAGALPEREFQEWLDAYWAKDIQELFRLGHRDAFMKLFELIHSQSGGLFDATQMAKLCEVSRQTIVNYLKVLETTFVAHVIRPFNTHKKTEIVSQPKVYGFDTGFMCYLRGWYTLRREDFGILWEHFVLNELQAALQGKAINFWRNKAGHEIDFVIPSRGHPPIVIECKSSPTNVDFTAFTAFSKLYSDTYYYVVCPDIKKGYCQQRENMKIDFVSLKELLGILVHKPNH